ncbi:MAG: molybdenum cofactor guanylyltransferase [bacterium]
MKTIVIAGAHSNVGKTTLAKTVRDALPGAAAFVKIGTGEKKEGSADILYPFGTSFRDIKVNHSGVDFLIIESNHVLAELDPDLCIFLGAQDEKPSAALARQKADLTRGCKASLEKVSALSRKLAITLDKMKEICFLAGANPEPVSAVIMAGGASSRMDRNKALLPNASGKTMVRHLYDTLVQWFDEVIISVSKREDPLISDARTVIDLKPAHGPLMGIYSSLYASANRVNFIIACDIPAVNLPLVRRLLSCSLQYDIVVPSFTKGYYEPLFAVYTKEILTAAKALLDNGQRKVAGLFPFCKTKVLEVSDCTWYANLNTPKDYYSFIKGERRKNEHYDSV